MKKHFESGARLASPCSTLPGGRGLRNAFGKHVALAALLLPIVVVSIPLSAFAQTSGVQAVEDSVDTAAYEPDNKTQGNADFDVDGGGNVSANSFAGDGAGLTNVNAVTAERLSSNPPDCGAGFAATGIQQNGNAQGCFDVVTETDLDVALECQQGMSAFGDWCIDDSINLDLVDAEDAISACIGEGKMLCPLEAIHACDVVNFMSAGGQTTSCGDATDTPGNTTIITSTFCGDELNGTSLNDLVIYDGADNSARCEDDELAQYFCCSTRLER